MSQMKGYSRLGLFGQINHYDELFGSMNHFDQDGNKTGESRPKLFGGVIHYDQHGKKAGESRPGLLGWNNYE